MSGYQLIAVVLLLALIAFSGIYLNQQDEQSRAIHVRSQKTLQPEINPLIDSSTTESNPSLLGTATEFEPKVAVIKNPATGELRYYQEGDTIDLFEDKVATLTQVLNCRIVIERQNSYQMLKCEDETPGQEKNVTSELLKYKILISKHINMVRPSEADTFENYIEEASNKHGVDPDLIRAVIKAESNFNPFAVSHKDAMGVMQIIPETALLYELDNPFDPKQNINTGVKILRDLLGHYDGDIELALAAYNAGKGAVENHDFQIPPYQETLDYVNKVLENYYASNPDAKLKGDDWELENKILELLFRLKREKVIAELSESESMNIEQNEENNKREFEDFLLSDEELALRTDSHSPVPGVPEPKAGTFKNDTNTIPKTNAGSKHKNINSEQSSGDVTVNSGTREEILFVSESEGTTESEDRNDNEPENVPFAGHDDEEPEQKTETLKSNYYEELSKNKKDLRKSLEDTGLITD